MKNPIQLILRFLLISTLTLFNTSEIYSQTPAEAIILSEKFENYKIVNFDFEAFEKEKNNKNSNGLLSIKIDKWDIILYPYELASNDYKLRVAYPDGIKEEKANTNITYRGSVSKTGKDVVLTITDDFIFGTIEDQGKTFFIEPISSFNGEKSSNRFVVYDVATIKTQGAHRCGVEDVKDQKDKLPSSPAKSMMGCVEVDLGVASDYLYYTDLNSSTTAVIAKTLGVMNLVDTDYDNVFVDEIRFKITDQFISTCNTCDPWTASTDPGTLLSSFMAWGNGANGFPTTTDLGQLWSGRDFDGTTIGLAYVGVVCGNSNYHILENYAPLGWSLRVLTSHEIGHNFDCSHDSGTGFIMSPSVNNTTTWSSASISDLNAHVAGISCLGNCSIHISSQNTATTWTANGSNTATINWDVNGSSSLSGCSNVNLLFSIDGGGSFPYTLASNITNDGSHTITIPDYPSTAKGRIKIECTSNAANDINNVDIELISACIASSNFFVNNSPLNYNVGQTIDLDVTEYISEDSYTATNFPNGTAVGYNMNTSSTTCATLGFANYNTYSFTVSATGSYTFQQDPTFVGYTLYDGTFSSTSPCGGFIASSMSASGGSISVSGASLTNTYTAGNTYTLLVTDYFGSNETVSFSGVGYIGVTVLPANYNYTYVAVDQVTGLIDMQSSAGIFTSLPAGVYDIYGVMYENDGSNSAAPPDVDPTTFVGQSISSLIATNQCLAFSENSEVLTITGTSMTWYADTDGDGFGDPMSSTTSTTQPAGHVSDNTDCNDIDNTVYPGAPELCDGQDNNCDNSIPADEIDGDGDNYVSCTIDAGGWNGSATVVGGNDCDDNDPNNDPGNIEVCDGQDNNCDTQVDEGVMNTYYLDSDGDGFGDSANSTQACSAPTNHVSNSSDCDDSDITVYPGAPELCDGQDNNCDTNLSSSEIDSDGDGYVSCTIDAGGWHGSTAVVGGGDCDDSDNTVYPGAPELCDGQDNNCDTNLSSAEIDSDGDGYVSCTIDAGGWNGSTAVVGGNDCDDSDNTVYPGAPELCDGQDNNCDTNLSSAEIDSDGDGYVSCTIDAGGWNGSTAVVGGGDCDDSKDAVHPGASELCDGEDNDCDGQIDEGCPAGPCDGAYLVINTITQNTYHAQINIESDATVSGSNAILYTAGTDIDLLPGFEVILGTNFEARIQPCTPFAPGNPVNASSGIDDLGELLQETFGAEKLITVSIINADNIVLARGLIKTKKLTQFVSNNSNELEKGTYKLIFNNLEKEITQDLLIIK